MRPPLLEALPKFSKLHPAGGTEQDPMASSQIFEPVTVRCDRLSFLSPFV